MRKMLILFIVCFLLFNSTLAYSADPATIAGDIALVRPLGLAATVVGGAIFIVCLPIALTSGSVNSIADALVGKPFSYTFKRPLGDFTGDLSSYTPTGD